MDPEPIGAVEGLRIRGSSGRVDRAERKRKQKAIAVVIPPQAFDRVDREVWDSRTRYYFRKSQPLDLG
jgi:hypothetical protein